MADFIVVEGLRDIRRTFSILDKFEKETAGDDPDRQLAGFVKGLKDNHKEFAAPVLAEAQRTVPVGATGALRKSQRVGATASGAVIRAGKKRVPYAGTQHFGAPKKTGRPANIRPKPWLYTALDRRGPEVLDKYNDYVRRLTNAD